MARSVDWEGIMQKHGVKTLNRDRDSLKEEQNLSVIWEILRPRSLRKSNVEELNGPRFSTDTGCLSVCCLIGYKSGSSRGCVTAYCLSRPWLCPHMTRLACWPPWHPTQKGFAALPRNKGQSIGPFSILPVQTRWLLDCRCNVIE